MLSAFVADPYPSSWLFVGEPGTGKTRMGIVLGNELSRNFVNHVYSGKCDAEFVRRISQDIYDDPIGPMLANWDAPRGWHFYLIDEIDQASKQALVNFLSLLDASSLPRRAIFVFTCNSTKEMNKNEARFVSRCQKLKFHGHGMRPGIAALLERVWQQEAPPGATAPNFELIAKECAGKRKGNPYGNGYVRGALLELQNKLLEIQRVSPVNGTPEVTASGHELEKRLLVVECKPSQDRTELMPTEDV